MEFKHLDIAVPSVSILSTDDNKKLCIDSISWKHLLCFFSNVASIPVELTGVSSSTNTVISKLKSEAQEFGAQKQLNQYLNDSSDLLRDGRKPAMLYASILCLMQRLHDNASSIASSLQSLLEHSSGSDVKILLQGMGTYAGITMNIISDTSGRLSLLKNKIIDANQELDSAYRHEVQLLCLQQSAIGSLQYRINNLHKGESRSKLFFSMRDSREHDIELQLLQHELRELEFQSETLRRAVGKMESVLDCGHWLKSGFADLLGFLEDLRKIFSDFGSGLTQLAADALEVQLEDHEFLRLTLGIDDAIHRWNMIGQAAIEFVSQSDVCS